MTHLHPGPLPIGAWYPKLNREYCGQVNFFLRSYKPVSETEICGAVCFIVTAMPWSSR
jgi:hypothetical protein